jgi:hypothetical protein
MNTGPEPDYSVAIRALQVTLRAALQLPEGSTLGKTALRDAAGSDPELFFQAAFRLLESVASSSCDRNRMYCGMLGCPMFLIELTRTERFSRDKLLQLCRRFLEVDKRLDIRLANLLPGRSENRYGLEPEAIARILDILNEISVGPRLVLLLNHLTSHPHVKVAEKATVLMGRRLCNPAWTQKHLQSGGPEVRAGTVEGLWGRNTPEARLTMRMCLHDVCERVVGNAVFGLHLMREGDIRELLDRMMADERPPFRATAAWLAGQIGQPEFGDLLQRAYQDSDASVRLAAKQAMVKIRRSADHAEALPKARESEPTRDEASVTRPKDFLEDLPAEAEPRTQGSHLQFRVDGSSVASRWNQ